MATQTTGGGSTTSFTRTPQAGDDTYTYNEGDLAAATALFLDVMSDDLGGKSKVLWSIDDGTNDSGAMNGYEAGDLLTQDQLTSGTSAWQQTDQGNWIRINNGQVEYRLGNGTNTPPDAYAISFETLPQGLFTDTFIYAIRMANGTLSWATVTVNIQGENNAPVAAADVASTNEDDAAISGSVATNDSDVDNGAVLSYALDGTAPAGFGFDPDGGWTFDPSDPAYQALAEGEELVIVIPYTVTDEHGASDGATLTITVTGTNDAPVAVADVASTNEDDAAISGSVAGNDSDVDNGAVLSYALDGTAPAGFGFDPDGNWAFDPSDPAYQALAEGEELVIVIPYTVTDEHGAADSATLTITVTGTNDAPVAAADVASTNEDDAAISGSVATNDSDVDNGAVLSYALDGTAPAGFGFDPDGGWAFDPSDDAYQSLAEGEELVIVIPYTVTDEHGASDGATLTITVTGTNDAPVAAADVASTNEDDAAISGSVAGNDSDVDNGAVLSYALDGTAPAGFGFDPDGGWTFDPSDPAYQALAEGEALEIVIPYTVTDEHGAADSATLTITVTGTNDAPVAAADIASTNEDDAAISGSVATNDSDVDNGAVLSYALDGTAPAGFGFDPDGNWAFDPSDPAYQALAEGEELVIVIPYTVTDEHGASDGATLTITVTGTNDAPTIVSNGGGDSADVSVDENMTAVTTVVATDVDNAATITYSIAGGADGALFTINAATGELSFAAAPDYENPTDADGNNLYEVIVRASDGIDSDDQAIGVTVTDVSEGPVRLAPTDISLTPAVPSGNVNFNSFVFSGVLAAMDPDPGAFTFTLASQSDPGVFSISGSTLSGSLGATKQYTVTVEVTQAGDPATPAFVYTETFAILTGSNGNSSETLNGLTGDDVLYGNGGADMLFGLGENDTLFGQEGNDQLFGGAGEDALYGDAGIDVVQGGLGSDDLSGGLGADKFRFTLEGSTALSDYGIDDIVDFSTAQGDKIELDDALFAGIGAPGALNASVFVAGAAAIDANDRIVYDQSTGALYYDADGSGIGAMIQFAELTPGTILAAGDFTVI